MLAEILPSKKKNQPFTVLPALHSVLFPFSSAGSSISTLEIRKDGTSRFLLRVEWTSADSRAFTLEPPLSDTSIKETQKLVQQKCSVHIIFAFVTSIEGRPLSREMDTFSGSL